MKDVRIIPTDGHYTGYADGEFYCTGDTYAEVREDIMSEHSEYNSEN